MDVATDATEEVEQLQEGLEPSQKQLSAEESAQQSGVLEMHKELRNWALLSLILGAASVLGAAGLDPTWGVLMIVIAILAWRIKLPAMLVLFSVLMAWAAVSNAWSALSGAEIWWLGLSLLQAYWTYAILRRWKKYSQLPLQQLHDSDAWPADLPPPQEETTITGWFAVSGLALGVVALMLLPGVFVFAVGLVVIGGLSQPPSALAWLIPGAMHIAVLALGLSCAALLSKNAKRGWAIGGVTTGALALVAWLLLIVFL